MRSKANVCRRSESGEAYIPQKNRRSKLVNCQFTFHEEVIRIGTSSFAMTESACDEAFATRLIIRASFYDGVTGAQPNSLKSEGRGTERLLTFTTVVVRKAKI